MRLHQGCTDCLISRVEYESRLCTDDPARIGAIVEACRELLARSLADPVPAPVIASRVHRLACRIPPPPGHGRKTQELPFLSPERSPAGLDAMGDGMFYYISPLYII